ncbi:NADH-quinone oxidoreductase subunit A [candidate division LCP-89 bacterium B3_LCP]|uniref:NADH-quinone oxidoreductase subunit A n=1 Tax=candidate division LCP-89 bacterium B3_LCP TaxID=2012998 RepID=A0A532V604_UNCL8|nr:MAG: NADH-quinone oxidoreductase subunit A [candidate division LCP-89 bacterium B3_LCP]
MNFGPIFLFLIAAGGVVFVALFLNRMLAPRKPNPEKLSTYECGEEAVGSPWIRFNTRFYVIALIFLVFDVEVLFLFPWAVNLKSLGMFAWIEMAVFIIILSVGLAYVWAKRDLEWIKPDSDEIQAALRQSSQTITDK